MHNFKPMPFYFINTTKPEDLTAEACRKAMTDLAEAGFGGCVLFNKPPTGFDEKLYLTDFWFQTLENFIIPARELGLEIWINDGFDYPPGDAAGRIKAENPDLVQQRLRLNAQGEAEVVDTEWGFPAFELPESSQLFIKYIYEAHKARLGKYFGNGIYGFFSDCDNRRINAFTVRGLEDGLYFPWSKNFREEFIKRCNYDVMPHLSAILKGNAPREAGDYYRVAGELYQQWFTNNHLWCQQNNLKYTFHTSDTGPLTQQFSRRTSIGSEGDPMTLLFNSDFPGTDHEIALLDSGIHYDGRYRVAQKLWGTSGRGSYQDFGETLYDVRAKYASSAAFMLQKKLGSAASADGPRTMCEMFAATNLGTDYQELRRIAMWQIMMGVNFIIPHAVHHRFYGSTKYFAPPEFMHGALRNGLKEFNQLLTDACTIASTGEYQAAVAVIEPTADVWRGNAEASYNLLTICDLLNRSAVGYVVISRADAEVYGKDFALVIDPANYDGSLDLQGLPGSDITFTGGDLAYMRRKNSDGSEFLIACNLWSDQELSGELFCYNKVYKLALKPGEYAVLGSAEESYRSVQRACCVKNLPLKTSVAYTAPQRMPLEVPEVLSVVDGVEVREFVWINRAELKELTLEWSKNFTGTILCDGVEVAAQVETMIFHDAYMTASLPENALQPGKHRLVIKGALSVTEPVYLTGETAVSVWADMVDDSKVIHGTYNLQVKAPRRVLIELEPRKNQLSAALPLALQGQVFYSGDTVWTWEFDLNEAVSKLDATKTSGVFDVIADGKFICRNVVNNGAIPLALAPGHHTLQIRLYGSLGAQLEGGNARIQLGKISLLK